MRPLLHEGNTIRVTHPDNEVTLGVLLEFLDKAEQDRVDRSIEFVPAAHPALRLRTAASRARSSIHRRPRPRRNRYQQNI